MPALPILFSVFATSLLVVAPLKVAAEGDDPEKRALQVEVFDQRATNVLAADAQVEILADGYAWTEGPLWIDEDGGYLLFSDIPNNVIVRYVPGVGASTWLERSGASALHPGDSDQGSNGLLLDQQGRLVLLQQGDRRVARMDTPLAQPEAAFTTLVGRFRGERLNSPNDGVFRSDGSIYFTDPAYGLNGGMDDPGKTLPFQGVYRLWPDGRVQLIDDSIAHPNGIGLSPDENVLYVAVSDEDWPVWLAYDLDEQGVVTGRREFFDASSYTDTLQGMPDGMAVHSSGMLFATGPGGVWLFSPEGEVLARILTGRLTANCALSSDEGALYITAHDTLMVLPLQN